MPEKMRQRWLCEWCRPDHPHVRFVAESPELCHVFCCRKCGTQTWHFPAEMPAMRLDREVRHD